MSSAVAVLPDGPSVVLLLSVPVPPSLGSDPVPPYSRVPPSAPAGAAAPAGAGKGKDAAAEYDRDLRKLISALEMSFNSGVANLKKSLDDTKDAPHLLAGKAPTIISALTSTENKVKKGMLDLKRKLMDIGKRKDEL